MLKSLGVKVAGGRRMSIAGERVARGARGVGTHEHWWLKVRGRTSITMSPRARGWGKSAVAMMGRLTKGFLHLGAIGCRERREVITPSAPLCYSH